MTPERLEELKKLLASTDFKEDSYKELPIQEIIVLKNSAAGMKESNKDKENVCDFFDKREKFFAHLVMRYLQNAENVFVIFSKATNMPFVYCDPDTCDDQIWLFTDERFAAKQATDLTNEKKHELVIVKMETKMYLGFYLSLYSMGVNQILIDRGFNAVAIELSDLVRQPDYSQLPVEKRPVMNPELVLTGIYFTQELRRNVEFDEKVDLAELEDEVMANVERGRFIVPIQLPEGVKPEDKPSPKDIRVAFVKTPNDEIFQPLCTDPTEFQKFNREQKFHAIAVDYDHLKGLIMPNTKGIILNPVTLRMVIPRDRF